MLTAPRSGLCRFRVMSDKTHIEHNETALDLIADMPGDMDFCCNGPIPDLLPYQAPRWSLNTVCKSSFTASRVAIAAASL